MASQSQQTYEGKANIKNGVSRALLAGAAIAVEVAFALISFLRFSNYAAWISGFIRFLGALLVLAIYSQHKSATIRMTWVIIIMGLPVLGVALYLLIGLSGSTKAMRKRYETVDAALMPLLPGDEALFRELREQTPAFANISRYLKQCAGYPLWKDTAVTYYKDAADGLEAQLKDLRKAKRFIFMEYHAIEAARAFGRIMDVLTEKVKEGVEVRVFYDDIGSIGFISTDFVKQLNSLGIQCRVFNPVGPLANVFLNNRDHRKITVIDGQVGFTGGYNLADEYFHLKEPFGFWKDTGLRLEGPAVKSLTVTFLEMWNAVNKDDTDDRDYCRYLPDTVFDASSAPEDLAEAAAGFVQPYADSPLDNEHVGENVYMSLAESAKDYVWFMTPYLLITDEMSSALGLAAKRGVDVRIVTPGIPDKKLVYQLTRSYYASLVRNGVRVFEYTPGFCHAKMAVADDEAATCGTINMDYRSLYHHFENGCIMYKSPAVLGIKKDFESFFPECREVTEQYRTGRSHFLRLGQLILRLAAPLM